MAATTHLARLAAPSGHDGRLAERRVAGPRQLLAAQERGWRARFPTGTHNLVKQVKQEKRPLIAVVGPCGSGKSLLVRALRKRGHNACEVLQEHSHVPTMWRRITEPDLLVYLDVSWQVACRRRPIDARADWWDELARRLHHARQHADIYINTDNLTPREVLARTLHLLHAAAT